MYYIFNDLDLRIYLRCLFLVIKIEKLDEIMLEGMAKIKRPYIAQNEAKNFPSVVV